VAATPGGTSVAEHEIRVAARPETVFAHFTDPAKMVLWMGTEATLDPRPGGTCRINVNGVAPILGEYIEVDPYDRIVFTWGWEQRWFDMPPKSSEVEVTFTPDGDGTLVKLTHTRIPEAAARFHTFGWTHYMERLRVVAEGGDPGPDPMRIIPPSR
jgi:uncharacterized protein YndB with AHSA1/START domain